MKQQLTFAFFVLTISAYAQNVSKLNVGEIQLKNSGVIRENNQVRGYYFFYELGRRDSNTSNFSLVIMNENLQELKSIELAKSNKISLVEAAFNGDSFAFLFFDIRGTIAELVIYDKKFNQVGFQIFQSHMYSYYVQIAFNLALSSGVNYTLLAPVPNKGFLLYNYADRKKAYVEFFNNKGTKLWNYFFNDAKADHELASVAFVTEKYVGTVISKKEKPLNVAFEYDLVINEISTGKQLCRTPLQDGTNRLVSQKFIFDEVNNCAHIFGDLHYKKGEHYLGKSNGIFNLVIKLDGTVIKRKYNTWENDVSKFANIDSKGNMEDNKKINFHDIIRLNDGEIFAIGEQYKNKPINTKFEAYDLYFFRFDSDFNLKGVKVFQKEKTVTDYYTMQRNSSPTESQSGKWGFYDYKFSQINSSNSGFTIAYTSHEELKGEKDKDVLSFITYTSDKQYVVDKMAINAKSSDFIVRPGKEGYVMISEYFRKDKKIDMRLEKVNF